MDNTVFAKRIVDTFQRGSASLRRIAAQCCFGALLALSSVLPDLAFAQDWLLSSPAYGRRIFPEPGAEINHSPVTFFWPMADGASAYTLSLKGSAGQVQVRTTTNYYVWSEPLPEGTYRWRVTAHLPSKSIEGDERLFELTTSASNLGETNANRLIALLSIKPRPRFFPKDDEWRAMSLNLAGGRRPIVNAILERANSKPLASESLSLLAKNTQLSPLDRVAIKRDATKLARDLEDTAFLWRLAKDEKWRIRAREIVSVIRSIDHPSLYSDPYDLLSARFVLWARVIAYDWMFDAFDQEQRAELRSQIEKGSRWLAAELVDSKRGLGRQPFDSHRSEVIGAALLGAACLLGEAPFADQVFKDLLPLWLTNILPTVASDGAAGTSGAYTIWDIAEYGVPHWDALRWSTGLNVAALTQVRRMGDWLVRTAPPGAPAVWWGDGTDVLRRVEWEGAAHLLASRTGDGLLSWYVEQTGFPKYPTVWHALAPLSMQPAHLPKANALASFRVFPMAGLGILNSDLADPNAASIHFRSSPFGSAVHAHYDQNSFVIAYKGRLLAIDSGAYDFWGSDHYYKWYKRTVAHNSVTWDGGTGQEGTALPRGNPDASGRIVDAGRNGEVAFIVGDASKAYGPDVTRARRTLAYLPGGVVAIFDDLAADTARRWEWNLHAISATLQPNRTVELSDGPAKACVDLYSEHPATPNIVRRHGPSVAREWGLSSHDHIAYSQDVATKQARFITLIRLDCNEVPQSVHFQNEVVIMQISGSLIRFKHQGIEIGRGD